MTSSSTRCSCAGSAFTPLTALWLVVLPVVLWVLPGCAPRPVRLDPTPGMRVTAEVARADGLVRIGCYTCLKEAFDIYQHLAASESGGGPFTLATLDTALLMAIRERELGLGSGRARQIAGQMAAALPPPLDYSRDLDIVDAVGWKASGVSAEQQDSIMGGFRTVNERFAGWRASLRSGVATRVFDAYALVTLECLYSYRLRETKDEPWVVPADAPPLLRFRKATCSGADSAGLDALLKDVPRLTELNLFIGERTLAQGRLRTAERQLTAAVDDIPDLMAARGLLGFVAFQMEDFETARVHYHTVVAAVPGQRDAMLGEAKVLSYLGRQHEAIAVLDEMVRLGTWMLGEAHYWLAWNRHRLKQFDRASDEVVSARKFVPMDPNVDKLAGLIALARNEIERAEREFRAAVEHYAGRRVRDCDAGYYLASVLVTQKKWAEGAERFVAAMPCYADDEADVLKRIDEIKAADLPDDRKARLVAAKEKQIPALQAQAARAAFNGAVAYANLGDKEKARPLAEKAVRHPDLAEAAQKLLARL